MRGDFAVAILAGGLGKRLWPLSSPQRPKQFLPLFKGRSMLQNTFERAAALVGDDAVLLVGNVRHEGLYKEQLPKLLPENLLLEPTGRGTAAALAFLAVVMSRRSPETTITAIPSDHVINDDAKWATAVKTAMTFAASKDRIVCLGTAPRAGEIKFGHMVSGECLGGDNTTPVLDVDRFIEKPDAHVLQELIAAGNCLRNMGTVAFRPDVLSREMRRLVPDLYDPLSRAAIESQEALEAVYGELPDLSFDRSVLERSRRVAVARSTFESVDAGDFVTLGDAMGRDESGNASQDHIVAVDSTNNTVFAEDVRVALVGVEGLVIVVEGDQILVCPADETQRIKNIADNN